MNVTKCDSCKKVIKKDAEMVTAGVGSWLSTLHLCPACGKPVKDFLIKKELIKNKTKKI